MLGVLANSGGWRLELHWGGPHRVRWFQFLSKCKTPGQVLYSEQLLHMVSFFSLSWKDDHNIMCGGCNRETIPELDETEQVEEPMFGVKENNGLWIVYDNYNLWFPVSLWFSLKPTVTSRDRDLFQRRPVRSAQQMALRKAGEGWWLHTIEWTYSQNKNGETARKQRR